MNSFRILPLLVFVVMLAFSVRMADVISGVSSFSGSANAAAPAKEEPKPLIEDDTKPKEGEEAAKEKTAEKEGEKKEAAAPAAAEEKVEWRDPNNENPDYIKAKNKIFDELAVRRDALDKREKGIVTREALLTAAEQEIDRKYQELSQLRTEIEKLLVQQSDEEKARVESLVKIYEGMKPKDAARIFDTLDMDVLVSVVGAMSERKLSPIVAQMNPDRARTLTITLAEQKKLPELPESN